MLAIRGKKFGFDKVLKIIVTGGASMMQFHHSGGVAASLAAMVKAEAISGGGANKLKFSFHKVLKMVDDMVDLAPVMLWHH